MELFLIFAAICVVATFFLIYPYLVYPLVLGGLSKRPVKRAVPAEMPKMTLVFCAFNEGKVMKEKLANLALLKSAYPNMECLAFDDGSTDDTLALMNAQPDLITVVAGGGRNGKAHGMKRLAAMATGDILVFTDANVTLRGDALSQLASYFQDSDIGGVCGTLEYAGADMSATSEVGSAYWRLEEYLKKKESETGNVMGADGSIFAIRRELYPSFPDTVLDDLTVSMSVIFAGKRLVRAPDVIAYERLVTARTDEFSRKIRISARAYNTHKYLRGNVRKMSFADQFKYYSRKYIRWFGAVFFAIATLSSILAVYALSAPLALAWVALIAILLGVGYATSKGPVASIFEVIVALIATFIGVSKAISGKNFVVWNPAKSRS